MGKNLKMKTFGIRSASSEHFHIRIQFTTHKSIQQSMEKHKIESFAYFERRALLNHRIQNRKTTNFDSN